jgi:hypothetical protein
MTQHIREQIAAGAAVVESWPAWKQNILASGSQSQNVTPRTPITEQTKTMTSRSTRRARIEAQDAYKAWCSALPIQHRRVDGSDQWEDWLGSGQDQPLFSDPYSEWRPKPKPEPEKPSQAQRTPQQAMKEARESGVVEAWENGLPIQVRYHSDDWEDFSGEVPNFQAASWVWRTKAAAPPNRVHLDWRPLGDLPGSRETILVYSTKHGWLNSTDGPARWADPVVYESRAKLWRINAEFVPTALEPQCLGDVWKMLSHYYDT